MQRAHTRGRSRWVSTFSPLSLFSEATTGVWYDPSDFSTMFQDSAGTTPVTAVGQSVGKILDKSGRGNHATQATAGNQPVLQQDSSGRYYLLFNGTSSSMATSNINFTTTDKMFVCAGLRKSVDSSYPVLAEISSSWSLNSGTFTLGGGDPNGYAFGSRGTASSASVVIGYDAPITNVLSGLGNISANQSILRINGTQAASSSLNQGTGNYGNYPLYLGSRAGFSLFFNGRLYQLVVAGKNANTSEIRNTEKFINQSTGAY